MRVKFSSILLIVVLLCGSALGYWATKVAQSPHQAPSQTTRSLWDYQHVKASPPLGTQDVHSAILFRELDTEVNATKSLLDRSANTTDPPPPIAPGPATPSPIIVPPLRSQNGDWAKRAWNSAQTDIAGARQAAEEGNVSWALEQAEIAYLNAFSLANGFDSRDNATREKAAAEWPDRLHATLDAADANASAARNETRTREAFALLTMAELNLADARATLTKDVPPHYSSIANDSTNAELYDTLGGELGRVSRRLVTANFFLYEVQAAINSTEKTGDDSVSFLWGPSKEEAAKHEIARVLAEVQSLPRNDSWSDWLASTIYPETINISLERNWTEAALEAAFYADSQRAASLAWDAGSNGTNARRPDAALRGAWENATANPLTAPEASEASIAGEQLTIFNARGSLESRDGAQAMIFTLAQHRATRAQVWDAG